MATWKLTLEYDGTDFVGWQFQPNGRSVQEVVEAALATLLGHPTRITGAGRTDSGVHAAGQVASFATGRDLPSAAFVQGLNSLLPKDVAVVAAEQVDDAFCARRSARGKRYAYAISNRPGRAPLRRRTHWEVFRPLDVEAMRIAAAQLVGEHDFSSFRAAACQAKNPVRTLWRLSVDASGDELLLTFEATAFLQHMVRNLAGTLVEVGLGKREATSMEALLATKDRTLAGETAPPQGLVLAQVWYGDRID